MPVTPGLYSSSDESARGGQANHKRASFRAAYRRVAVAIIPGLLAVPLSITMWAALNTYCRDSAGALSPLQFTWLYSAGNVVLVLTLLMVGCLVVLRQQRNKGW